MIAAPAFVIQEALARLWPSLSVGMTEYLIQGLMPVLLCLVIRRFRRRYLPAFAVAVIYGYTLNFFLWVPGGVKTCFDVSLLIISPVPALTLFGDVTEFDRSTIGYAGFHSIGLGTPVTTAINSPIIALMGKPVDRLFGTDPLFPKLKKTLGRN